MRKAIRKLTGFAWYRFKVTLPSHPGPLALWVPLIATNFQIYADGRLIAENGAMPPHPRRAIWTKPRLPHPRRSCAFRPAPQLCHPRMALPVGV